MYQNIGKYGGHICGGISKSNEALRLINETSYQPHISYCRATRLGEKVTRAEPAALARGQRGLRRAISQRANGEICSLKAN
jgi:hypothetical protein